MAGHPPASTTPYADSWHIEGGWFRYHLSSPEQALLSLFCFSTVDAGGGGTLLVEGSHHLAAPLLFQAEPDGLEADDFDEPLTATLEQEGWPGVVEVLAEEEDVLLAHPLVFHSANPNRGNRPRVMAQPAFSMTEAMRTEGNDLWPVEIPLARVPNGTDRRRSGSGAESADVIDSRDGRGRRISNWFVEFSQSGDGGVGTEVSSLKT